MNSAKAQARINAEQRLECRLAERSNAIDAVTRHWDQIVARARTELREAMEAERAERDELAGWVPHDGSDCPLSNNVPVYFRTKTEWRAMLAGTPLAIDEDQSRYAHTLRWRWEAKDYDDIAAYKVVACDSGSDPEGENGRSPVECEASQSGGAESGASPTPLPGQGPNHED